MSQAAAPESLYVCKEGIADIDIEPEEELSLAVSSQEAGKEEQKIKFVELRAKGLSYRSIARRLKVSKSTLAKWSQELKEEIASLKAYELEALQERYFLAKEGRIKLLGEQIKAIQQELKGRPLSDVSTDKLLDILLRYYGQLKEEFVDTRPLSDREIQELKELG